MLIFIVLLLFFYNLKYKYISIFQYLLIFFINKVENQRECERGLFRIEIQEFLYLRVNGVRDL